MKSLKTTSQKVKNFQTASKFYMISAACFISVAFFNISNPHQFLSYFSLSCSLLTISLALKVRSKTLSENTDGEKMKS